MSNPKNEHSLVILAAGASSRMKTSTADGNMPQEILKQANSQSKGLISVGSKGRPLLDYILYNAKNAGYRRIILVVGENYDAFKTFYGAEKSENTFHNLTISYAIQHILPGREKPFGTADAVFQAMEQYPDLQKTAFTVCNSDNLYSEKAFRLLQAAKSPNALILYDRNGLKFSPERIAKFAVMDINSRNELEDIVEKPPVSIVEKYRDHEGIVRVSMNIFKFDGEMTYPFFKNCPITPGREEKEIPTALKNVIKEYPGSVVGIPLKEHVPDLTEKKDIVEMQKYLQKHYPKLDWV